MYKTTSNKIISVNICTIDHARNSHCNARFYPVLLDMGEGGEGCDSEYGMASGYDAIVVERLILYKKITTADK